MRKYDEEYKREALRKVFDGQSVGSEVRELGVAEGLIHNWKKLREVEMECDILKKAALIFGRGG